MERYGILILALSFVLNVSMKGKNKRTKTPHSTGADKIGRVRSCPNFEKNYLTDFNTALKEFEDIHQCRIKVKTKKLNTTMAARPTVTSLFRKIENRTYVICVNNDVDFDGVLLQDVPEEARIGLFAHELMHIRDYQSKNFFGLIKRGWQYLSKSGKRRLEYYVDQLTIDAGFGQNLYEWAFYVWHQSDASEEYKAFKKEIYMSPGMILQCIDQE
ncbi:hypothetical protein DMA11_00665 [Marinilabiliaceae bacterium JC017]|nr:hypothetical protein DMA11_00665 [Marinilabiliaceae bacterium JC017]